MDGNLVLDIDINLLDYDLAVKVLKMAYSFESWHNLLKLSDAFHRRIANNYDNYTAGNSYENHQRPLVYYYGYSLLMKGLANKELEDYDEARTCIDEYSNLSWFQDLDDEGFKEVEYYKYISQPNRFEVELLSGNIEVMDHYVSFLSLNPKRNIARTKYSFKNRYQVQP